MTGIKGQRTWALLAMAGLLAAVFLSFQPVWTAGFIWDDDAYVLHNPHLATEAGLREIWTSLTATPQFYPMVFTSYWIEYQLWGLHPAGYHLVNLALHTLNVLLLFGLLRRWNVRGAWIAALLFALHPVCVESVAWITERKNTLSLFFALLTLQAWTSYAGLDGKPERRSNALALGALLLFLAALLSKTVTSTLPAVILVLIYWKQGRIRPRDALPLIPMFLVGIGFGLLTAWLEAIHVGASGQAWSLSLPDRFLLAIRVAAFYAWKVVLPVPLMFFYPRWEIRLADPWLWVSLAGLLIALSAGIRAIIRHQQRGPLAALLIYLGVLFPALGFFNVYPMRYSWVADHFQYHALPALLAVIAAGLSLGLSRLNRQAAHALLVSLLTLMAMGTYMHSRAFTSAEALWLDTIRKNDQAWMAHNNLGYDYYHQNLLDHAEVHYIAALTIKDDLPEPLTNLGLIRMDQGRLEEALEFHRAALVADPAYAEAHNNLALALIQTGQMDAALDHLLQAVALKPEFSHAYRNLGNLYYMKGRHQDAVEAYRKAVRPPFIDPPTVNNLAWLLATSEDSRVRNSRDALFYAKLNMDFQPPGDPGALDTLAAAYASLGNFKQAIQLAEQAKKTAYDNGDQELFRAIQTHLGNYRAGRPVVEAAKSLPAPD